MMTTRDDLRSLVSKITFSAGRNRGEEDQEDRSRERTGILKGSTGDGNDKTHDGSNLLIFFQP